MKRQWKPAKTFFASTLLSRCAARAHNVALLGAIVAVAASVFGAQAATAGPTHTTVEATTRQAVAGGRTVTETVLTAHVTDASGTALGGQINPGTVSFDTATTSLGSAIIDTAGDATIMVTSLPPGDETATLAVHAVYHPAVGSAGAAVLAGSVSSPALLRSPRADASAPPDFTVTANPTSLTVKAGEYGTTAVTITPTNGFNEQVTLSCSNLPAQVSCNFSPVIASTATGAFTSTLEVQTQAASGAITAPGLKQDAHLALAWLLPGALVLAGLSRLRRRAGIAGGATLALLAVVLSGLGLGGCSSRYGYIHHPPSVAIGTPIGTYPAITIAASGNDGSAVTEHDITITLQVQ